MAIVYLNGRFVQAERAKISAFDRGFSYGDGLFETLRAYSGWVFALDRQACVHDRWNVCENRNDSGLCASSSDLRRYPARSRESIRDLIGVRMEVMR